MLRWNLSDFGSFFQRYGKQETNLLKYVLFVAILKWNRLMVIVCHNNHIYEKRNCFFFISRKFTRAFSLLMWNSKTNVLLQYMVPLLEWNANILESILWHTECLRFTLKKWGVKLQTQNISFSLYNVPELGIALVKLRACLIRVVL